MKRSTIICISIVALLILVVAIEAKEKKQQQQQKGNNNKDSSKNNKKSEAQLKKEKQKKRQEKEARKREEEKQRILQMLDEARKMDESVTYYSILDISSNAGSKEIKKAFNGLSRIYHPDVDSTKEGAEKYQMITKAYGVLKDKTMRKAYDRFLRYGDTDPLYGNEIPPETADIINSVVIITMFLVGAWYYFGLSETFEKYTSSSSDATPKKIKKIKNPSKNFKRVMAKNQ